PQLVLLSVSPARRDLHPFPTRRSSDLFMIRQLAQALLHVGADPLCIADQIVLLDDPEVFERDSRRNRMATGGIAMAERADAVARSEEHTSELQSRENLVCRLLLEKKNN